MCFNSNWFDYSNSLLSARTPGCTVSIPTGSITVEAFFALFPGLLRFQFQLVRLQFRKPTGMVRPPIGFNSNWFDYSIAAGLDDAEKVKFQFQLVRLQSPEQQRCG